MWEKGWRERTWAALDKPWDMVIIGGGITGAGVLRLASHAGLRVLLVDAADFASGTSSRSSKLVHGGFRYLFNRQFNVTRESVHEREWMLREADQLVKPLPFILPNYERYHTPRRIFSLGVMIYDIYGRKWSHRGYSRSQTLQRCPSINPQGLLHSVQYYDAEVDDSRLVLRVLSEAVRAGGTALNYARVVRLLKTSDGTVCGVVLKDTSGDSEKDLEVQAKVVINASGPWSDEIRSHTDAPARLRKLRGSHLIFPRERFPSDTALTIFHPRDKRAMFVIPWSGATMVGTTDLDHPQEWEQDYKEPFASLDEVDYMLEAVCNLFPSLQLGREDIIASFSGLRPVVRSGAANPSKESRGHAIWEEDGLITITGGKLTTFRIMAQQTLEQAFTLLPGNPKVKNCRIFDPLPALSDLPLSPETSSALAGRFGSETRSLVEAAHPGDLECVDGLPVRWAELRWAARNEAVQHLDDLLLRRVRLGLLSPSGGIQHLDRICTIVQPELGWDDRRWEQEVQRYRETWQMYYAPLPEANYRKP